MIKALGIYLLLFINLFLISSVQSAYYPFKNLQYHENQNFNSQYILFQQLGNLVKQNMNRSSPFDGDHLPTWQKGSFDFHSLIHGLWTLLSMERLAKIEVINEEQAFQNHFPLNELIKYLENNPKFEMPYGRAWLNLLLFEISQHPKLAADYRLELKALLKINLTQMITHLHSPQLIDNNDYSSLEFILFIMNNISSQFFDDYLFEDDHLSLMSILNKKLNKKKFQIFLRQNEMNFEVGPQDLFLENFFLSLTIWEHFPLSMVRDFSINDKPGPMEYHQIGIGLTTLWISPHKIAILEKDFFPLIIKKRINELNQLEFKDEDSAFQAVTHWIPQFIWMIFYLQLDDSMN